MDRLAFDAVAVAFMILGAWMMISPARIVAQSRDADDDRPTGAGELLRTRIVGAAIAALAAYGLYALLAHRPGSEFFPV